MGFCIHTFETGTLCQGVDFSGDQTRPGVVCWGKVEAVGRVEGQGCRGRNGHSIVSCSMKMSTLDLNGRDLDITEDYWERLLRALVATRRTVSSSLSINIVRTRGSTLHSL